MRCSWLIPVRDGGAWLSEAVDSACAECGPSDEVVVVDDGSTDDAVAHLKPHARLRVIHQSRSGITQRVLFCSCQKPNVSIFSPGNVLFRSF